MQDQGSESIDNNLVALNRDIRRPAFRQIPTAFGVSHQVSPTNTSLTQLTQHIPTSPSRFRFLPLYTPVSIHLPLPTLPQQPTALDIPLPVRRALVLVFPLFIDLT
jgi:hypothetical protein